MLSYLHVKNLALIKDVEVSFRDGLNVLSGETGAGKSILLGSVNLVLGSRADSDLIRTGETEASVELIFSLESQELEKSLEAFGIYPENHEIIISRKLRDGKSLSRINGEAVTARTLKEVSSLLINIHGQHEHQTLLNEDQHLTVLDNFGREELEGLKADYLQVYKAYREKKEELLSLSRDPEETARRLDFLSFQIREIQDAKLKEGEEAALLEELKLLEHQDKMEEAAGEILSALGDETQDAVSEAVKAAGTLASLDKTQQDLFKSLQDLEAMLQDTYKEASHVLDHIDRDPGRMNALSDRLSLISGLKRKYGDSEKAVLVTCQKLQKEYDQLSELDAHREDMEEEVKKLQKELVARGKALHEGRKAAAGIFDQLLTASLKELNFNQVIFQTHVEETNRFTPKGADQVCFYISTNPGEEPRPMSLVASGGELSRIMLAIKTLTADSDDIHTLIFDEIDTGISGKTAARVAMKMKTLAQNHQVLCISHLPQIVAASEHHYLIEKTSTENETISSVRELTEEESIRELARLLGAGEESQAALQNAKEMKKQMGTLG